MRTRLALLSVLLCAAFLASALPAQDDDVAAMRALIIEKLSRIEEPVDPAFCRELPPAAAVAALELATDAGASGLLQTGALAMVAHMVAPGVDVDGRLADLASDPRVDSALRAAAARALAIHAGAAAVPALRELILCDETSRLLALDALGLCPASEALDEIDRALELELDPGARTIAHRARESWLEGWRERHELDEGRLALDLSAHMDGEAMTLELRATAKDERTHLLRARLVEVAGAALAGPEASADAARTLVAAPAGETADATGVPVAWLLVRHRPGVAVVVAVDLVQPDGTAQPLAHRIATGLDLTLPVR